MISLTFNGCFTIQDTWVGYHEESGLFVRTDGAVLTQRGWTYGSKSSGGYLMVCHSNGGSPKKYLVHRLIAETFLPNPEHKPTVDHWNRIRTDNRAFENLKWATYKEQRENSSTVLFAKDLGVRRCDDPKEYSKRNTRLYYREHSKDPEWMEKERKRLSEYRKTEKGREKARERQRRYRERKRAGL